jgi:hypothetical protein
MLLRHCPTNISLVYRGGQLPQVPQLGNFQNGVLRCSSVMH